MKTLLHGYQCKISTYEETEIFNTPKYSLEAALTDLSAVAASFVVFTAIQTAQET